MHEMNMQKRWLFEVASTIPQNQSLSKHGYQSQNEAVFMELPTIPYIPADTTKAITDAVILAAKVIWPSIKAKDRQGVITAAKSILNAMLPKWASMSASQQQSAIHNAAKQALEQGKKQEIKNSGSSSNSSLSSIRTSLAKAKSTLKSAETKRDNAFFGQGKAKTKEQKANADKALKRWEGEVKRLSQEVKKLETELQSAEQQSSQSREQEIEKQWLFEALPAFSKDQYEYLWEQDFAEGQGTGKKIMQAAAPYIFGTVLAAANAGGKAAAVEPTGQVSVTSTPAKTSPFNEDAAKAAMIGLTELERKRRWQNAADNLQNVMRQLKDAETKLKNAQIGQQKAKTKEQKARADEAVKRWQSTIQGLRKNADTWRTEMNTWQTSAQSLELQKDKEAGQQWLFEMV
jgi:chromosome segregation ATPase